MNEPSALGQNASVFRWTFFEHPEPEDVTDVHVHHWSLNQVTPRGGEKCFLACCLCPIGRVRRWQLWFSSIKLTPNPAYEPKAVTTNMLSAALMTVRRAKPAAGDVENILLHLYRARLKTSSGPGP